MNTTKSTILQQNLNWSQINWKNIKDYVTKLQQQIFLAEKNQNKRKVKQLQRRLIHSKANLLLAIRNNTLTKRSADTDICQITNHDRENFYSTLLNYNLHHFKMHNDIIHRILQALIISALEPQWEAKFESQSYFRTGRTIYDAIGSIYNKVGNRKKRKWVLNLNFDTETFDIDYLLQQINDFPYREIIESWIKNNQYDEIKPLLTNILLHGLESLLQIKYNKKFVQVNDGPSFVRYYNHVAIFCKSEKEIQEALIKLEEYSKIRGIKIKYEVKHITEGFNFNKFNIRLYQAYKNNNQKYKLFIKPSKESIQSVINQIKAIFDKYKGNPVRKLIQIINPIILSTAYSWRTVVSSPAFKYIDYYVDYKFYHHIKRLHPRKNWSWIKSQYYFNKHIRDPKDDTVKRIYCRDIPIKRYALVPFDYSPFNPSQKDYWDNHYKHIFCLFHGKARVKMALRQKFLCPHCLCNLYGYESLEMNHIMPVKFNGKTVYKNIQLMHASCHIEHHKKYRSLTDFVNYQEQQTNWYNQLWEKNDLINMSS